ncbi:MAG: hypothetical protein HY749_19820 [Gammaproteobacteria bacterium]|nr:hypothetical protein [Gammaproteobacteria bacterium]MBI5615321.1 hypothetical protein [Gammaproteobacteria bacterium]
MIIATGEDARWLKRISDGVHTLAADTTAEQGGAGAGCVFAICRRLRSRPA